MKEQISKGETDLKTTYILASLIPIFIGAIFLFFVYFSNNSIAEIDFIKYFSLGCLTLGVLILIASSFLVPYCHKIEVDNNNIYVTKSETIITTAIENTITISKDELEGVSSSFLGLSLFNSGYRLYYLDLSDETEFGKRIALLSKRVSVGEDYFELRKLKK